MSAIDPTEMLVKTIENTQLDMMGRLAVLQGQITRDHDNDHESPEGVRRRLLMIAERAEIRLLIARLTIRAHDLRQGT